MEKPKEQPDNRTIYPIGLYAPGNYSCTCSTCGTKFVGDKRAVQCEPCAIVSLKNQIQSLQTQLERAEYENENLNDSCIKLQTQLEEEKISHGITAVEMGKGIEGLETELEEIRVELEEANNDKIDKHNLINQVSELETQLEEKEKDIIIGLSGLKAERRIKDKLQTENKELREKIFKIEEASLRGLLAQDTVFSITDSKNT